MPVIRDHSLEHYFLERPAFKDPLWRYMDFAKFVAMLVYGGLYFSRLDRLGDAYEGWIPEPAKKDYGPLLKDEYMKRDQQLKTRSSVEKKRFYVNCWHANDEQSDAMWKLYAKGNEGMAIRTTSQKIEDSLKDSSEKLWLYKVSYTDQEKNPNHGGSMVRACLTKRKAFVHEKEVRIVWYDEQDSKPLSKKAKRKTGFYVKCNFATLIEQVYVAPTENPWFAPIVEDVLNKYGIKAKVIQSGLNFRPR